MKKKYTEEIYNSMPKSGIHNGHRDRMRERFLASGGEGFADHELLEMLLYYAIPRRDTNEIAHELIEECGSLSAVLEASPARLSRVPYVKENTTLYLKLLAELSHRYTVEKIMPQKNPMQMVYDSTEKVTGVLYPRFLGQTREMMYAMLFDGGMHMLDLFCIGEGSIGSVSITVRAIAERAYQRSAASVVIAHNHPGGVAIPSPEDIRMTRDLNTALSVMGIQLVEHFVFAESSYYPIIAYERGEMDRFTEMRAAQHNHLK